MTNISKPIRRKTATEYKGRGLVVTLHPRYLEINEQRHEPVTVDYETIYELALKLDARRRADAFAAESRALNAHRRRA